MALEKLMTEPEYRQVDAISYSKLAGVAKSPASLIATEKLETPSLTYGSAVDTLAFDGEEEFKKKFAIMSGETPSKIIDKIVNEVINVIVSNKGELTGTLDDYDDLILNVAKANEYGKGWHNPTILRKVKEEGGNNLFQFKKESAGKLILDELDYTKVVNSVHTLYTHDFSRRWFNEDLDNGIEITFQYPIFWVYEGKKCKCLFDIFYIDHVNKIIYPVDLKTSYDHVLGFPFNYLKWMYPLQASFYSKSISYWKLENPKYFDYYVDYFRFVIISSQNPMKPLVYKTTEFDIFAGEYGGTIKKTGEKFKGFKQLIGDMEWHLENGLYDYPREIYEMNGEVELDVF